MPAFPGNTPLVLFIYGLAMVAAQAPWIAPPLLQGYARLARLVLAPSAQAELELRVAHLARTRSLDTGAAELRRIERDLHDGAQARLVAMGLTLDAAGHCSKPCSGRGQAPARRGAGRVGPGPGGAA